ncbi:MAG TPA: dephospho-CoA kinase [Allocoleopsis sp.]
MKVIGLTGTIASGKSVVAQILKSKGFEVISLSSIIRDYLSEKDIVANRKSMQDAGNELRKEFGGQVLAERSIKKYLGKTELLVIDGIRNIDEVDYLRKNCNFTLIGVDAPIEIRWERVKKRNRDNDLLNYDKFLLDDARDRGFNEPLNGQQVGMCLVQADFLVINDEEYSPETIIESKIYKETLNILEQLN